MGRIQKLDGVRKVTGITKTRSVFLCHHLDQDPGQKQRRHHGYNRDEDRDETAASGESPRCGRHVPRYMYSTWHGSTGASKSIAPSL